MANAIIVPNHTGVGIGTRANRWRAVFQQIPGVHSQFSSPPTRDDVLFVDAVTTCLSFLFSFGAYCFHLASFSFCTHPLLLSTPVLPAPFRWLCLRFHMFRMCVRAHSLVLRLLLTGHSDVAAVLGCVVSVVCSVLVRLFHHDTIRAYRPGTRAHRSTA